MSYHDIGQMTQAGPNADEPVMQDEGGQLNCTGTRFLQHDELGSVVGVADCSGNLQVANTYDEYGIPGSGAWGRYQYTGQAWIPDLGMSYYKARFYSPTLGRFMQTDPIGYKNGPNWYAYVHNDPINGTDSTGMMGPDDPEDYDVEDSGLDASLFAVTLDGLTSTAQRLPANNVISDSDPGLPMIFTGPLVTLQNLSKLFPTAKASTPAKTAKPPASDNNGCPQGGYVQISYGGGGTAGVMGGQGGSVAAGLSFSPSDLLGTLQIFGAATYNILAGVGAYIGGGDQVSFSYSNAPLPAFSTSSSNYGEIDGGWGPSAGGGATLDDSGNINGASATFRTGVGFGGLLGAGKSMTATVASPPACKT